MAQPKLNQKSLNSIAVPLPPLPEQKRIVAILDEAFAGIDAAVANARQNLANARELFESYLNAVSTRKGEGWWRRCWGMFANSVAVVLRPKRTMAIGTAKYLGFLVAT
jgi:hypothetical protein